MKENVSDEEPSMLEAPETNRSLSVDSELEKLKGLLTDGSSSSSNSSSSSSSSAGGKVDDEFEKLKKDAGL